MKEMTENKINIDNLKDKDFKEMTREEKDFYADWRRKEAEENIKGRKIITSLYERYKNTNKKLKIVCDWDEVIQAAEPYCLWLTIRKKIEANKPFKVNYKEMDFATFFKIFWSGDKGNWWKMDYDNHGVGLDFVRYQNNPEQTKISPFELECPNDFYQQTPFLTIAEDLLRLIKEDKVEELILLTNSSGVGKREILEETFAKLKNCKVSLRLMPEERKKPPYPQTKADWVKHYAPNFDIFIDDNPNICKEVNNIFAKMCHSCYEKSVKDKKEFSITCFHPRDEITVLSPYYPAIENQHHSEVLLVKNEVSDLKKEDFNLTLPRSPLVL